MTRKLNVVRPEGVLRRLSINPWRGDENLGDLRQRRGKNKIVLIDNDVAADLRIRRSLIGISRTFARHT